MQAQKIIEQLGFSAKEARVYLVALGLGECHITDIAEKVKLPRTSVQVIVDKLNKAGLMNFYVMKRYKYWVAEDPERLLHDLKQKENLIGEALPQLVALRRSGRNKKRNKSSHSLELFRMLADTAHQPMLIANGDIEIEYVNKAWEKQFGYSLEEVRGENPRIFKSEKTPGEVYKQMWQALNAEKLFQTDEIIDKRKDGVFFNLLTTIFTVCHEGDVFFIQILDDITERKRVEALRRSFTEVTEKK